MSEQSVEAPASRIRVRWYWWALAALAVLCTAVGAFFSASTIAAAQDMPRSVVARYLTALEHGRAREAMALGGITAKSGDILLTDAAYRRATDRITSFTLARPTTRGGITTVDATVQQGDRPYHRTFRVVRAGGLPFLPLWRLAPVTPDTVEVGVDGPTGLTFTVAGATPHAGASDVRLRALPGSYPVAVTSPDADYTVSGGVALSHPVGSTVTPTVFAAQLSDAGSADAQKAVDSWLDACLATQDAAPVNCPFLVKDETVNGVRASDFRWTLDARPEVTVDTAWTDGGFAVRGDGGAVQATATLTRLADGATAQVTTEQIPFSYAGEVTFTGDGAVFRPSFGDDSGQG
ncbi:hypothetical protein [Leifsonia shinshuensis]|uniref:hypothetical protein n=1 Tax=Leifsonia shinshuensis TaxID=150026 RepID=UPI002865AC64|nr:hypothetical protein [Leifsonia shinshuensis]MDR6971492.1 hypothetical protein [Leifsonia shinshuensis]